MLGPGRSHEWIRELTAGAVLVVMAAAGGVYFALRPASGRVDGWFLDLIGASNSSWYTHVTSLRHPVVIVVGSVIAAAVSLPRDRARAAACLVGPPLALLACELVAKPLVGRTLGGTLSYPSGSTVGAAALATAAVLVTPGRWRAVTIVVASLYALWMAVAVVSLRWHYPTDALAGLAFGVGVVLVVDAVASEVAQDLDRWQARRRVSPSPAGESAPPR
jgi:membrane-associated phospholipid phosphatase